MQKKKLWCMIEFLFFFLRFACAPIFQLLEPLITHQDADSTGWSKHYHIYHHECWTQCWWRYFSLLLPLSQSIILIDFFNMMKETRYFLVVNLSNFDAVIFSVNQCSHTKYKLYIGNRYAQGPRNRGVREAYEFSQIL